MQAAAAIIVVAAGAIRTHPHRVLVVRTAIAVGNKTKTFALPKNKNISFQPHFKINRHAASE